MANTPRVVIDTNVWLSALYFSGNPAKVVHLAEEKKIVSLTSEFILDELKEKMVIDFHTPTFAAYATISYIQSISEAVPTKGIDFGLRDEDDNLVLETAISGRCQFLITGDKDLLSLKEYNGIKVVTPTQFLVKQK